MLPPFSPPNTQLLYDLKNNKDISEQIERYSGVPNIYRTNCN